MKKTLFLLTATAIVMSVLISCASSKMASNGCSMNRGFVGYGKH